MPLRAPGKTTGWLSWLGAAQEAVGSLTLN
jgi:hypothetical protein